jgi:murein DD-endopeptidase MepM/ murein hydrolase activator NlpD
MRRRIAIATCILLIAAFLPSMRVTAQRKHSGAHTAKKSGGHTPTAEEAKAAAARQEQIRQHLLKVKNHMHDVKVKLQTAKRKEAQITETIDVVQGRINTAKSTLRQINHKLSDLSNRHVQAVARLTRTQDKLTERRRLLGKRLRENYERRRTTYAEVLLQSRNVHQLLSRAYYVKKIVRSDAELVSDIKADVDVVSQEKHKLEQQAVEEKQLAAEYEEKKASYASDLVKKQKLLASAQEVREQAQDELDELESESNEMTNRIRALSEVLRQRQEALRREAAAARRNGQHPDKDTPAPLPTVFHGHFIKPCPGRITSTFGMRYHPVLHVRKLHTGVDFGAPRGTPIHAAAAGVVIIAGYNRGYGNCVIIDHGGGISTLYGHCSSLAVSEGQSVKQGQVIGRVGSTGYATGPHLHWEVRRNGTPVRPL